VGYNEREIGVSRQRNVREWREKEGEILMREAERET